MFIGLSPEDPSDPNTPEALDDMRAFVGSLEIPWVNGYGADESLQALGVRAFPTAIVLGKDGRIAHFGEGDVRISAAIDAALAAE